jgi:hypothetical protein
MIARGRISKACPKLHVERLTCGENTLGADPAILRRQRALPFETVNIPLNSADAGAEWAGATSASETAQLAKWLLVR